jgi:hypothetical protein
MKLKKGSAAAKAYMAKIRKKRKVGATQTNLFDAPKKPTQRGTSNKLIDSKRKAKAPGKRTSATGRKYHETRKNRSDVPGTLTGIGSIKIDLKRKLAMAQLKLALLVGKLAETKQLATATKSKSAKASLPVIRKKIIEAKKIVLLLKKASK